MILVRKNSTSFYHKPDPAYNTFIIDGEASYRNNAAVTTITLSDNTTLSAHRNWNGSCFLNTSQLSIDNTYTEFIPCILIGLRNALESAFINIVHTEEELSNTFLDTYNLNKVTSVSMKLLLCSSLNLSSITYLDINGVDILPYIINLYGEQWYNNVTWTSRDITTYGYLTDSLYRSYTNTLNCTVLNLTNLPLDIVTNFGKYRTSRIGGFDESVTGTVQMLYNFKLINSNE